MINSIMTVEKAHCFYSPGKIFVMIGMVFGFLFVLSTPPFHATDEWNHFFRAYGVSEGRIIAKKGGIGAGDYLPKSLIETAFPYVPKQYSNEPVHMDNREKLRIISGLMKLPLDEGNRAFVYFPNTALYSPVPYLPQAAGIALGRVFDLPPIMLMYLGRASNLLAWVFLIYISIKAVPFGKWLFFMLGLMPMALFQASSVSADAFTNAIGVFYAAIALRYAADEKKKVRGADVFLFSMLSVLIALSKQAYFLISALFLLIPGDRAGSRGNYYSYFLIILSAGIGAMLLWGLLIEDIYMPLKPNVAPERQMVFLIENPGVVFIIIKTVLDNIAVHAREFVGYLGHFGIYLPVWLAFSYIALLAIAASVGSGGGGGGGGGGAGGGKEIKMKHRLIILAVLAGGVMLVIMSQFLIWTPAGQTEIEGVNGRYFIPLAPLFFLPFCTKRLDFKARWINPAIAGYSIFTLSYAAGVVLYGYY